MSILLTMKPGASFLTQTGVFPILSDISITVLTTSSLVFSPWFTSMSFMITGGLKKCMPMKRSGLDTASAILVMLRLLVFDA